MPKITKIQAETLKKLFEMTESGCEGFISKNKLSSLLQQIGQDFTDEKIIDILELVVENDEGLIRFEEFLKIASDN